jgi:RNA polymerase sigma-70 factor (ECF subfamily)
MLDDGTDLADQFEAKRAGKLISDALQKLNKSDKKIFVLRYWMSLEINQITELTGYGESRIKMSLLRTRKKLAEELKKGGFTV